MDILALLISIAALVLSFVQFIRDASRGKKEATLNAFYALQNEVFDSLDELLVNKDIEISAIKLGTDEWGTVTTALAKIEQFSVGINTNIYSIEILNRVAGAYFILLFENFKPIIEKKRSQNISKGKHYDEFEQTVLHLKKIRGKRSGNQ